MTHCNIITLFSESKPLELGLIQRFCKFGMITFQKGSPPIQSIGNMFFVSNSVKQGGVLSRTYIQFYLHGLLTKLNKKGVSCHMGTYFVGWLSYVDDLTIIAPSTKALQIMIINIVSNT